MCKDVVVAVLNSVIQSAASKSTSYPVLLFCISLFVFYYLFFRFWSELNLEGSRSQVPLVPPHRGARRLLLPRLLDAVLFRIPRHPRQKKLRMLRCQTFKTGSSFLQLICFNRSLLLESRHSSRSFAVFYFLSF